MDKDELELLKQELEQLKDIPVLEGELEWVMKVIDSPEETITSVLRKSSLEDDSTE
jgi:hypothetical protein